jgi:hypothetical protein
MTQQNPSPLNTARPGSVSASAVDKAEASAKRSTASEPEGVRGQNVKKARGLDRNTGNSPNEAGTDMKVEDAKRTRNQQKS